MIEVFCMLVGQAEAVVPGSTVEPCSVCSRPVWLSPVTRVDLEAKEHRLVCCDCSADVSGIAEDHFLPPSPGQVAELLKARGLSGLLSLGEMTATPARRKRITVEWLRSLRKRPPGGRK